MSRKVFLAAFLLLVSLCVNACALDFSIIKKDGSEQDADVIDGEDGEDRDVIFDMDVPDTPDIPVDEVETVPSCGNGIFEPEHGEECDDGANGDDADGCTDNCEFSCHENLDCWDGDICNGEEICDTESHTCEQGTPATDGTVCVNDPRSICIGGDCLLSTCGDGFVDTGAGESCEPPGEGDCNANCRSTCESDPDCPDDGNICNGEEFCDTGAHECSHRNAPADGTECQSDPKMICIAQTCQVSSCGDGFVDDDIGEECEGSPIQICTSTCGTQGEQRCESCTWSDCYPPDEVCNGEDDDCDGQCDNGFDCCIGEVEDGCVTCDGTGSAVGSRTCSDTCGWGPCCSEADYCNGCDDDCDGETDELVEVGLDLRLTNDPASSGSPSVAYNQPDDEYGIAFHDARYGGREILFAVVGPDGTIIGTEVMISTDDGLNSTLPSLVHTGSEYAVTWDDERHGDDAEIYFARFDNSGAMVGSEVRITNSLNEAEHSSLAFTGSEFAVAWDDERDGGYGYDEIFFARISLSGVKLTPDIRLTDAGGFSRFPSLVFTGSEFGMTWHSNRDVGTEIYFKRIAADGTPLGSDVRITNAFGPSEGSALVFNGTEFGVAWIDGRGGSLGVYFKRIDTSGAMIGADIRVSDASNGNLASPYILANKTTMRWDSAHSEYGVMWYDDRDSDGEIYFTRLATDGTIIGPEYRVSNGIDYSVQPALARGASHWVLAWEDHRHGGTNYEIYYALFGCLPVP